MREIISSTGASLFTAAVLIAQTWLGASAPAAPVAAHAAAVVAAR